MRKPTVSFEQNIKPTVAYSARKVTATLQQNFRVVRSLKEHSGQYLLVAVKVLELQLIESYDPTTYLFENPTM